MSCKNTQYSKVGIIPAAGKASRFNGNFKELLPAPDGRPLIAHAVERLSFCDEVFVVTSLEKYPIHKMALGESVHYVPQTGHELWGAMRSGYRAVDSAFYFMTMPDTYTSPDAFKPCLSTIHLSDFGMGLFTTNEPQRFGTVHNGYVCDKNPNVPVPARAWGVLAWSQKTACLWESLVLENYTRAINYGLGINYCVWSIPYYYDCGDIDSYIDFLNDVRGKQTKENA